MGQGVIWGGLAIAIIFVAVRIFARLKAFKKLYADDIFVLLALTLALATAILWQVFGEAMFELMAVSSGAGLPGPNFVTNSENYSKASVAVIFFFYSTLWSIKVSFLLFFKRLGKNVRRQNLLWWPIFGFTTATYFACIGTIQYGCLTIPLSEMMVKCTQPWAINFQQRTLKLNCAWDVLTDFFSE